MVTIEVVAQISTGAVDFIGAPYEFWVGADVPIGASVGQIRTNLDFEGQSETMYDLLHSYSEGVPFAVEERSGIVTVIRDFADFDRVFYEFEAVAAHVSRTFVSFSCLLKRSLLKYRLFRKQWTNRIVN